MNLRDHLDEETLEEIEEEKKKSKRDKTKYGSMLNDE